MLTLFLPLLIAQDQSALKEKYLAITSAWVREAVLKRSEIEAMEKGRQWENLMMTGLDDPLAKKILAFGEPSYDSVSSYYPGKVLDRTILGSYSDPRQNKDSGDEFVIWWNGAISANLLKSRISGAVQPVANNTNVVFRVGSQGEMFGKYGDRYSRIGYEEGYLPIVIAKYESDGFRYRETAFAHNPKEESSGQDTAFIRFDITNLSSSPRTAELHEDFVLIDGSRVKPANREVLDASGKVLLTHSDPNSRFDEDRQRLTHQLQLESNQTAALYFKIPYVPASRVQLASQTSFDNTHQTVRALWTHLLSSGAKIQVPEQRVNNVWRALLLQNLVLADGPRFTYGSGLRYNDSYYPVENGFGAYTFAWYGLEDHADAYLAYLVPPSVQPAQAGRKYQNRRGIPLHHLLEIYRLTKKTDIFEKYKQDLFRVAEEIIADRHSTMIEQDGKRPLHWGLLPPDKPAVDLRASTQTVYVTAHNITSCQGLQDFGEFLVRTGLDTARGERYLKEAKDFRSTILNAMEKSVIRSPGRPPFVDLQTLYFRETPEYGPEPYDDLAMGRLQGTYYHYWADMQFNYNFFNPDDSAGRWIAGYLDRMGGFVLGCTRARRQPGQPYGWINNVYNGGYYNYLLRSGNIEPFLLGFYSRLAYGMSRYAYVASEGSPFIGYNTKDGGFVSADYSFPNSAANAETLSMLRFMLVLEELKDNVETGDIYLAKGVPRAWFEDGKQIQVMDAPTYFGKLSYAVESMAAQGVIGARIKPPTRDRYKTIVMAFRHPAKAPIRRVKVNGAGHNDFDPEKGWVRLPYGPKEFVVEVLY